MTQAPGAVDEKQLRELHIRLRKSAKAVEGNVGGSDDVAGNSNDDNA
jgi:aspartyl-tRNA synthetase